MAIADVTMYGQSVETTGTTAARKPTIAQEANNERLDFSSFRRNNWLTDAARAESEVLRQIEEKGGALWMNTAGKFYFRRTPDEPPAKVAKSDIQSVLSSYLDRPGILLFSGTGKGEEARKPDIARNHLLLATERFDPRAPSEFYTIDNAWYRSGFYPSRYMMAQGGSHPMPKTILRLIFHLCNYDEERYRWMLNWLAAFFQTLRKSQVSLLLRGEQGAGKGILFERVISPLFGETFCPIVDDERLKARFNTWALNAVFINLDEISHGDKKDRVKTKNILKKLITSERLQIEGKGENAGEKRIFANILITSNEPLPVSIEPSDRRFTVFETGGSLRRSGWNIEETLKRIDSELMAFAAFLRSYPVDMVLYDTAMDTEEKRAIVEQTNNRMAVFIDAIGRRDIDYFEMNIDDDPLLEEIKAAIDKGEISGGLMAAAYNHITESDLSAKSFVAQAKKYRPKMFAQKPVKKKGLRLWPIR